jgi:hypothetical protein
VPGSATPSCWRQRSSRRTGARTHVERDVVVACAAARAAAARVALCLEAAPSTASQLTPASGRGASAPPGPSSPVGLHRQSVGALTSGAAFPLTASALAIGLSAQAQRVASRVSVCAMCESVDGAAGSRLLTAVNRREPSSARRGFPQALTRRLKEAYAVRRTVPPSAEIEEQIDQLLAVGSVRTRASRCRSWPGSGRG